MPNCYCIGEAAGIAADIAVKEQKKPGEIDGRIIRDILTEQGAF